MHASLQVIVHKRREEEPPVVAEAVPAAAAAKAVKKKKKKKDAKLLTTQATAAADSTTEQQDDDSMQVVEPAAVADDAAEEQELATEPAAATAGDEQLGDAVVDTATAADADADSAMQHAAKGTGKNHKKNQRKKRNKLLKEAAADAAAAAPAAAASAALQRTAQWSLTDEQAASMAQWIYLGVPLHPALLFNLHKLGFTQPTAIQRATLPKAILGRRDIVGAAETGSGKTLAYGLPILSAVLHSMDDAVAAAAAAAAASDSSTDTAAVAAAAAESKHVHQLPLQALILCPTRELALQVTLHLTAVSEGTGISIVSVVGGLAEVKQRRLLKRRPAVVVATPGRLWEMRMSEQHLRDLSGLRYLVIDEADRMTEKGRFDELGKLMRVMTPDSVTAAAAAATAAAAGAQKGGKRGSKKQAAAKSSNKGKHSSAKAVDESWMQTEQWLIDDDTVTKDSNNNDSGDDSSDDNSDNDGDHVIDTSVAVPQPAVKAVARQIFIYSATLSMQSEKKPAKKGSTKSKSSKSDAPEANLERIMEVVGMVNKPSVVDLSQGSTTTATITTVEHEEGDAPEDEEQPPPALPENLTLAHVKSLQMEKDAWLYLFCTQYSGRTLVFVNAIVMARRLAEVLKLLRIPCAALHAQMQQRQRLRSLDFLRTEPTAVLIATDVAARGLDVPSVDHVVHYDMPRSAADFVHR
jgi:ATP-dependent RNA helicase DDX24/MAK5